MIRRIEDHKKNKNANFHCNRTTINDLNVGGAAEAAKKWLSFSKKSIFQKKKNQNWIICRTEEHKKNKHAKFCDDRTTGSLSKIGGTK